MECASEWGGVVGEWGGVRWGGVWWGRRRRRTRAGHSRRPDRRQGRRNGRMAARAGRHRHPSRDSQANLEGAQHHGGTPRRPKDVVFVLCA